jgi:two-component system response regulator YesN
MYKILIIDDEEIITRGIRAIIERGNIRYSEIREASNGRDGLEAIRGFQPDIVITDIRMPYLDGLELISQVHQDGCKRPIFIIISGYDDFNYAKRAIKYGVKEYLLKPIVKEEFLQLLQHITQELDDNIQRHEAELVKNMQSKVGVELLKEKYFNSLIHGTYYDENTVSKQLLQLGVDLSSDRFKILVAEYRLQDHDSWKAWDEMERVALKEAVDEGISGIVNGFWSFYDSGLRLVILLGNPESFLIEAHIKKVTDQITRILNAQLPVATFYGVGNSVTGLVHIQKSYHEALYLALYKIFREPGGIMYYKDAGEEEAKDYVNSVNYLKLISEIELGMNKNVGMMLDEYFEQLAFHKGPIARLVSFYEEFNKYMYDYFTEKGIDFSIIFEPGEDDFRDLDSFWAIDQLKTYLKEYLTKIAETISTYKSNSPDRKIIEQIIRYMRENFDKEINLNIVADHFGKNNSYLSVLFKKETGQNFLDYLTMIRMEKAKELLAQHRYKIQEVAGRVGYSNAKHFCMVFKKVVGISPTQYREESFS